MFVPSFMKISQRVSELCSGHEIRADGHMGGWTDRQTDGQGDYYRVSADFIKRVPNKIKTQSLSFIWKYNLMSNKMLNKYWFLRSWKQLVVHLKHELVAKTSIGMHIPTNSSVLSRLFKQTGKTISWTDLSLHWQINLFLSSPDFS